MSEVEQLIAGLELTLAGMVTVFVLLAFMVLVIQWMSRLAHYLQPASLPHQLKSSSASSNKIDSTLVSAISAAVHRYRHERR
jgi:sodium pump decarboxylase gamma subunit